MLLTPFHLLPPPSPNVTLNMFLLHQLGMADVPVIVAPPRPQSDAIIMKDTGYCRPCGWSWFFFFRFENEIYYCLPYPSQGRNHIPIRLKQMTSYNAKVHTESGVNKARERLSCCLEHYATCTGNKTNFLPHLFPRNCFGTQFQTGFVVTSPTRLPAINSIGV